MQTTLTGRRHLQRKESHPRGGEETNERRCVSQISIRLTTSVPSELQEEMEGRLTGPMMVACQENMLSPVGPAEQDEGGSRPRSMSSCETRGEGDENGVDVAKTESRVTGEGRERRGRTRREEKRRVVSSAKRRPEPEGSLVRWTERSLIQMPLAQAR
jgi:hypothetical protein